MAVLTRKTTEQTKNNPPIIICNTFWHICYNWIVDFFQFNSRTKKNQEEKNPQKAMVLILLKQIWAITCKTEEGEKNLILSQTKGLI